MLPSLFTFPNLRICSKWIWKLTLASFCSLPLPLDCSSTSPSLLPSFDWHLRKTRVRSMSSQVSTFSMTLCTSWFLHSIWHRRLFGMFVLLCSSIVRFSEFLVFRGTERPFLRVHLIRFHDPLVYWKHCTNCYGSEQVRNLRYSQNQNIWKMVCHLHTKAQFLH